MSTNNSVNVTLSGQTGTGNFVGANTPTLITPVLGAATATSITFSPTTGGIVGTTTNDNVTAGDVGEFISSNIAIGSHVALSNATSKTITSITLGAGDYDVWGWISSDASAGTIISTYTCGISTSDNTLPTPSPTAGSYSAISVSQAASGNIALPIASLRASISGSTTYYLVANISFSVSTCFAYGFIAARRRR